MAGHQKYTDINRSLKRSALGRGKELEIELTMMSNNEASIKIPVVQGSETMEAEARLHVRRRVQPSITRIEALVLRTLLELAP